MRASHHDVPMMTRNRLLIGIFLTLFAVPHFASAQDMIFAETSPIPLNPDDPDAETLGELSYRGGIVISPGEEEIGAISGLEWSDGQLVAVTDTGQWMRFTPDELRDRLVDITNFEIGSLLDLRGKRLKQKDEADAEAIAQLPNGDWLVSFEREHRIWRYADLAGPAQPSDIDLGSLLENAEANGGIESLAVSGEGWLACGEWAGRAETNCLLKSGDAAPAGIELAPPELVAQRGGAPTGADCASNGVCYVLFRSFVPGLGNTVAIDAFTLDGKSETLATWAKPYSVDNFEGLAVREENGRTYLYLVSDNNESERQRNLLMKFEVSQRASTTPGVAAKVYETVNVVIETNLGEIIVALETERAPVTAANFLRYVDEGRFEDTRCYRAMRVKGGQEPSGFVQCGTQNNPARILEGIAHESTLQTGLSHFDGALSMARFEPGTATGDFSIMIQDQRGLDANPDSDDPSLQAGFAVFGYVIDGMDTVIDMQKSPIDPEKGEGFLKGQMLAEPVTILNIRRAVR